MSEKLSLLLRKIIREEIRTELQLFKKEIIQEIRNGSPGKPLNERSQGPTRQPVQSQPKQSTRDGLSSLFNNHPPEKRTKPAVKKFTDNPLLNEILSQTPPADDLGAGHVYGGSYEYDDVDLPVEDDLDFLREETTPRQQPVQPQRSRQPIVNTGPNGEVIDTSKPEVKKVLDIMNMNFSGTLKALDEAAKDIRRGMQ